MTLATTPAAATVTLATTPAAATVTLATTPAAATVTTRHDACGGGDRDTRHDAAAAAT